MLTNGEDLIGCRASDPRSTAASGAFVNASSSEQHAVRARVQQAHFPGSSDLRQRASCNAGNLPPEATHNARLRDNLAPDLVSRSSTRHTVAHYDSAVRLNPRGIRIMSTQDYQRPFLGDGKPYNPMREPRFAEIATFMRAPLAAALDNVDIGLVGVPTDLGVTNRPGARHGPREIRNASSLMRGFNLGLGVNPYELCRVADLGDVHLSHRFDLERQNEDIEAFYRAVRAAGILPVSAGGDHSITYPILRALGAERPVGMVHVDAHTDTWGEFFGSKFTHGAPFRLAVEAGVLDPKRTIQIGIRGGQNFLDGIEFSKSRGMRVVFIEEFAELGVDRVIAEARRVVGDGPTYISFDVDGLDPVYAPGTGTPEIGGITTLEAQRLLRGLRGLDLLGGDVVEVAPPYDQTGNTALVGATMMYEILCLIADRHFGGRHLVR